MASCSFVRLDAGAIISSFFQYPISVKYFDLSVAYCRGKGQCETYRMIERLPIDGGERLPFCRRLLVVDVLWKQGVREVAFCFRRCFRAYV